MTKTIEQVTISRDEAIEVFHEVNRQRYSPESYIRWSSETQQELGQFLRLLGFNPEDNK